MRDGDFIFENKAVTVIANRNEAEIQLGGLSVGPFKEGTEYDIRFWVAEELAQAGIVRFREEDTLDIVKLHKIHWKERVQPTTKASPLPEAFYPQLRRYVIHLRKTSQKNPDELKDYDKCIRIAHDIVNSRVKKIVSLSSSPPLPAQALQSLTPEEQALYHRLHHIIHQWRTAILSEKGDGNGRRS